MIFEPLHNFLEVLLGSNVMSDPFLGGISEAILVCVVVLFALFIVLLPFCWLIKIFKFKKKRG